MTFFECIKMAFSSMKMNKMRSFLTMLGIIIGISSVITISSIGSTIKKTVSSSLYGMGLNDIYITVVSRTEDLFTGATPSESDKISDEMIQGLLDKYPGDYDLRDQEYLYTLECIDNENEENALDTFGVYPGYLKSYMKQIIKGRNLTYRDIKEQRNVAVVSEAFEKQYCPDESIIGKTISLNGLYNFKVTVVGVYNDKTNLKSLENGEFISTELLIPYSLALKLKGVSNLKSRYVYIQFNPQNDPNEMYQQAVDYFEGLYKNNQNFTIWSYNMFDDMKYITVAIDIIAIAFALIAAISLVVGGVGVMNIMLVSVVERTSEIGIRKALGAKTRSIKRQFVTEAILICSTGGLLGIIFGLGGSYLLGYIANIALNTFAPDVAMAITISVSPSILAIIVSVICSILIGVIFGSSPAKRAAKMNPIDALRFE